VGHDLRRLQAEYDIPIDMNEAVVAYVRFFQAPGVRKHFVKWLGRMSRYQERYRTILREEGLPEDTIFLAMIESGFANLATSRARAVGPWQFISATGKRMGLRQDFWVDERRDPEKSARAASAYLKELHAEFGDWRLAWAGYNAGGGKIQKAQRKGQMDFWSMAHGKVLKRETKGYVPKLMAAAIISKHAEAFGFRREEIEAEAWPDYEEVRVAEAADVEEAAKAAGVTPRELHDLNPELRRSCTPPRAYALKVPRGTAAAFQEAWSGLAGSARLGFANHTVVKGEGLAVIAAAYGVPADSILRMNGLSAGRRVKPGTELVIPLGAQARRGGAPTSEALARARIGELQQRNAALVEPEPAPVSPRPAPRVETVDGKARATVQVQNGDTLWAIAQKFGVAVTDLCRWNGIRDPRRHKLQVGKEIVVYPRTAPTASLSSNHPG
jgi:membrane-bound lytic murein transglycosylase D